MLSLEVVAFNSRTIFSFPALSFTIRSGFEWPIAKFL